MTKKNICETSFKAVMLVCALLPAFPSRASAQRPPEPACPELADSSPAQQLKYLSGDRGKLTDNCIEVAVRRLGNERYAPAIDTLVLFLDFKSEGAVLPPGLVQNPFIEHEFLYPARTAISNIGALAVDRLTAVLADASASDTAIQNAAVALTDIRNESRVETVAALTRAAKAITDAVLAARLRGIARRLANECPMPNLRSQCELALN